MGFMNFMGRNEIIPKDQQQEKAENIDQKQGIPYLCKFREG